MALRGALTHRKTRRLAAQLGIDPPFALGVLEALWHVAGEQHPDGGVGRMSNADLAMEMFYTGDAERLVAALVEVGYLDASRECRLYVHDWHLHADDTVDSKLGRATLLYANGSTPRLRKLSVRERTEVLARYAAKYPAAGYPVEAAVVAVDSKGFEGLPPEDLKREAAGEPEQTAAHNGAVRRCTAHNGALPEPEPEPVPEPEEPPYPPPGGGRAAPVTGEPGMPVLPAVDPRPGGPGWEMSLGIAVRWAARALNAGGRRVERALRVALEVRVGQGVRLGDAAGEAVQAWARLEAAELRWRWGPAAFYADGHWLRPQSWPYDREAMQRRARAQVGVSTQPVVAMTAEEVEACRAKIAAAIEKTKQRDRERWAGVR